jgi:hypothetical protein
LHVASSISSFLSATPHNGHSNSFAALLEILDPQRFCRGVPVRSKKLLDAVMVRRLKQDLREIDDRDFPERQVIPVIVDKLPRMLQNSSWLVFYRSTAPFERSVSGMLQIHSDSSESVITSLQKRLLSSIEAFARTLRVHRNAIERQSEKHRTSALQRILPCSYRLQVRMMTALTWLKRGSGRGRFQMAVATQTAALEITQRSWNSLRK